MLEKMLDQKIIDILNEDQQAKDFKNSWEKQMIEHNLSEKEVEEQRLFIMMVCIHNNLEARQLLMEQIYNNLRAE